MTTNYILRYNLNTLEISVYINSEDFATGTLKITDSDGTVYVNQANSVIMQTYVFSIPSNRLLEILWNGYIEYYRTGDLELNKRYYLTLLND